MQEVNAAHILREAFDTYRKHAAVVVGLALLLQTIYVVVTFLALNVFGIAGFLVSGILGAIITQVTTGSYTVLLMQLRAGQTPTISSVLPVVWPRSLSLLWASIIVGFCTGAGFVLFILPGVFIATRLIVTTPAIVADKLSGWKGVNASWRVTEGRFGSVFVIALFQLFVSVIIPYLVRRMGYDLAVETVIILTAIVTVILAPLPGLAVGELFLQLCGFAPPSESEQTGAFVPIGAASQQPYVAGAGGAYPAAGPPAYGMAAAQSPYAPLNAASPYAAPGAPGAYPAVAPPAYGAPPTPQVYGAPAHGVQPYGAPPSAQAYGAPHTPPPYGAPPSAQAYGAPGSPQAYGTPAHGAPPSPQAYGAPPTPQAYGAQGHGAQYDPQAYGAPPSPQAYGAPPSPQAYGAPPSPQAYGGPAPTAPPAQAYNAYGPPPTQPAHGAPAAQPPLGHEPAQPAYAPPPQAPAHGVPPAHDAYAQPAHGAPPAHHAQPAPPATYAPPQPAPGAPQAPAVHPIPAPPYGQPVNPGPGAMPAPTSAERSNSVGPPGTT